MATRRVYDKHAVAWVANVLASVYGAHIKNVRIKEDRDNGSICTLGQYTAMDQYDEAEANAGEFQAFVREYLPAYDGWLVEITKAGDAWFMYNTPIIEDGVAGDPESMADTRFFNAKDELVRSYKLTDHDFIIITEDGIDENSKTIEAGAELTINNYKLQVK